MSCSILIVIKHFTNHARMIYNLRKASALDVRPFASFCFRTQTGGKLTQRARCFDDTCLSSIFNPELWMMMVDQVPGKCLKLADQMVRRWRIFLGESYRIESLVEFTRFNSFALASIHTQTTCQVMVHCSARVRVERERLEKLLWVDPLMHPNNAQNLQFGCSS